MVEGIFSKGGKCTLVPTCIVLDKIFKHCLAGIKTGHIYKRMYVLLVKYTTHFVLFFFFLSKIIAKLLVSALDNEHKSRLLWPITFYSLKLDQVQEGG